MAYDGAEIRKEYKALFENSLDLIYAHDLKGNFIDANDVTLETLGYKRKDIPNLSFKDLIDKGQIVDALNTIKELRENGKQSKRSEYQLKTKNGDFIYVESYGIPLKKNGEIYAILGIANDITERKNSEKKLKESESKFRSISEQSLMGIIILQDGVFKYVNETAAKIGGRPFQEIKDLSMQEFIRFIHPDDLSFIVDEAKKKQAGETDVATQYSCRIFTKSGKLKYIDVYSRSILYQGKPADFITLVDITYKKEMEIALKESGKKLNNLNKELEQKIDERTQNLKQSEKKHRELVELLPDIIFEVGPKFNITYSNQIGFEKFGYSQEDINRGLNALEMFAPEEKERVMQNFRELIKGEIPKPREYLMKEKNGTTFYARIHSKQTYKEGNISGVRGIISDITERKIAEQKLKASEERFKALYKGIPIPTYTWQKDGNDLVLIDYNNASEKITDSKIKNYLGIKASELYKDQPVILEELYRCIKDRVNISREIFYYYQSTNKKKYLLTNYGFVPPDLVLVHTEDITDKKIAEEKLRKSEKKYRNIIENSKDAIVIVGFDGKYKFVSPQLSKMMGREINLKSNLFDKIHPNDLKDLIKFFSEAIRQKQVLEKCEVEFRTLHKDGHYIWLSSSSKNYYDKNGNVVGFITLLRDITDKKRAEEKLKESEEKYRHLFENSPFSILLVDTKGNIIESNSTIEKLYEIKKEEILNKNYKEIIPLFKVSELQDLFEDRIKKILGGMITPTIEIPGYTEDGSLVWINLHISLVKLGEKKLIQVILQDITERKVAEKELKKLNRELENKVIERTKELEKSEKKFRQIFESIPDLFFLVDENTTIIDYRGKREEFFISPEQFLSEKLSNLLPFKLGKMAKEYVIKTISSKQPQILEYCLPMKSKDQYYEARLLFFSKEQVAIFIRNITDRKEAEQQIKESEEKYRTLFDEAPIGILTCDVNGNILNVNTSALKLLGSPSKEATKKINLLTFPLLMKAGISADFKKCIMENRKISSERPYISKWGKSMFFRSKLVPTLDQEGKTIKVLGTFDDISNLKLAEQKLRKSEEKLRKQNIELRRLDELKNDFITIAAHELKTPMVSITGYTDYILTHNKELDFEIRKDLLLIQKNSQRLNLLIEKLLDVMKIDAKKMEIIREEKNIYDIIENCVEELSFQINDKKLNVIVDVQKDLYLKVDPNRIYEVFSNLFLNAVKFTLNGGNIEISAKKIKNQFLFKVRNDGKGLNIHDIRKLFKKFEVIEKESADHINRKKGLGLELYISKGIVEAHGGKIWGTSKGKDKGTEFYFTLPIIEA